MEIWKEIKGFENYQISNLGRVKNSKGDFIKFGLNKSGYYFIRVSKNSLKKSINVATLVATHFMEHIPSGHNLTINHISGNKLDNSVSNLEIVTSRENKIHSIDKNKTTSKYTGVHYCKKRNQWVSQITINGKLNHLGRFNNELEAAKAYKNKLEKEWLYQ